MSIELIAWVRKNGYHIADHEESVNIVAAWKDKLYLYNDSVIQNQIADADNMRFLVANNSEDEFEEINITSKPALFSNVFIKIKDDADIIKFAGKYGYIVGIKTGLLGLDSQTDRNNYSLETYCDVLQWYREVEHMRYYVELYNDMNKVIEWCIKGDLYSDKTTEALLSKLMKKDSKDEKYANIGMGEQLWFNGAKDLTEEGRFKRLIIDDKMDNSRITQYQESGQNKTMKLCEYTYRKILRVINYHLENAVSITIPLEPLSKRTDKPDEIMYSMRANNLLTALWGQFAEVVMGHDQKMCLCGCGEWIVLGGENGKKKSAKFVDKYHRSKFNNAGRTKKTSKASGEE